MEPQVWEPCNYQLADCSTEHAVWIPDIPVLCDYESTEMACFEETFVASSRRGQQLVQYAATVTSKAAFCVFESKSQELDSENKLWRDKMHRYPPSIRELGKQYTIPKIVSIGPYHHGLEHLKKAEEAKHVAAYSCIKHSGLELDEAVRKMYDAVVSVSGEARSLYDTDTMARIDDEKDFWPMMFYDACFLVQFMLRKTKKKSTIHPWLSSFFKCNKDDIYNDIMLLENQLPRVVIETLERFTPAVSLRSFATLLRSILQNSHISKDLEATSSAILYKQPHLLGYVRFIIVGTNKSERRQDPDKQPNNKVKSFSVGAIELAEMGIRLTPSETPELAHMGFKEGHLSAELFMPHIALNCLNASFLVNMAAFEITSKPAGQKKEITSKLMSDHGEDTAVCSYIQLLGMFMDREEDVRELRSKRILQGGGGLADKETLDFFTSLQGVSVTMGTLYHRTIDDVEIYKQNSWMCVKANTFLYRHTKTMLTTFSVIATLIGVYGALFK
uniref:Uncharacterized protein n=1 Tax=Avena sativa TaxID=4498 RepID=A0ACD5VZN2_AVESA